MKLRDYQKECIDNVFNSGVNNPLIVLPTGSGKTVIFSNIIKQKNVKTLVIAHRTELLEQANKTMNLIGIKSNILNKDNNYKNKVNIISVQTAVRRTEELKKQNYQMLVIDEAHHTMARSYMKVIEELGFIDKNKDVKKFLLGVTATPNRLDNIGLHNIFSLVYSISIGKLIQLGHLVGINKIDVKTGVDLTKVKSVGGDYNQKDLEKKINTKERNKKIVNAYKTHCIGKKTLIFASSIKHAEEIKKKMNHGLCKTKIKCEVLHSKLKQHERENVLSLFRQGKIDCIINCMILTEGFDEPAIEAIIMARPTKSESLFIQIVGRGLRPYKNKTNCLLIEIVDINHKIKHKHNIKGALVFKCDKCGEWSQYTYECKCGNNFCEKCGFNYKCFDCIKPVKCCGKTTKVYMYCKDCGKLFCNDCGKLGSGVCNSCYTVNNAIKTSRTTQQGRLVIFGKYEWKIRKGIIYFKQLKIIEENGLYRIYAGKRKSKKTFKFEYAVEIAEKWYDKHKPKHKPKKTKKDILIDDFFKNTFRSKKVILERPTNKQQYVLNKFGFNPNDFTKYEACKLIGILYAS